MNILYILLLVNFSSFNVFANRCYIFFCVLKLNSNCEKSKNFNKLSTIVKNFGNKVYIHQPHIVFYYAVTVNIYLTISYFTLFT